MIAPRPKSDQITVVGRLPTKNADSDVTETPSLLHLPSELLIENLRHLDHRSILRCSSVCRQLKKVIDSSVELQYRIELGLDCMLDGPPSTLTVAERLDQLRALRRAWTLFEWKKDIRVPMSGYCQAYELVGGVFAKTSPSAGILSHFGPRYFVSTWLPSSSDPGHTLVRSDLGIATRDFAIDPTQDLIALVKTDEDISYEAGYIEVYIRTISSNIQHPAAASPMLRTISPFPMNSAFIQIVDDVVGMMFWTEPQGGRIVIWSWKTGEMLVDRNIDSLPPNTSDFAFISSRAYMVTRGMGGGAIQVFTFGEDKDVVVHVANLLLPPLQLRTHVVVHSSIHTGPFVANCPPGVPFWTKQEDRIYVLSVQYIQVNPDAPSARARFCIFFKSSTPLRYIRKYHEQGTGSPFEVPWEEWGPRETRMLHHQIPYQWLRYVHGHRVVFPVPSGIMHEMQVLDFNISKSKRQAFARQPDSSATIDVVDYPSTISSDNIFLWPIETSLPYRICRRDELQGFSGVMVDERRLIGLKSPSFADGDMKDLHVFAF